MKKSLLLLSFTLLAYANGIAQVADKKENSKEANDAVIQEDTYNKWTIELNIGQSKGTRPYTTGYYSSNPNSVLGSVKPNYYNIGVRYMFSPKFGVKLDGSYDNFKNNTDTDSKPFEVDQIRVGLQGVVNAARLFGIQEQIGRFGLLVHAGFQYASVTPKLDSGIDPIGGPSNYEFTENNFGVMFGISPEFRITKRISIIADFSTVANFRQHFAWDGHYSEQDNNLAGQLIMGSVGLTYSFGQEKLHGDWAIIEDKRIEELDALDKRIGELETMMNDADKDGVPDYLDVENNSIPGVAVDTKGRMVDINKNGIPDELEKYMANNFVDKSQAAQSNVEMVKKLINDGYVTTYFDFNKTKPTNVSTEGIDFMLTYLRNNPDASIEIIGNADEIGKTPANDKLALQRANSVKDILVKAGIAPTRLNVISKGEDTSVDKDSAGARKLVRRVTFRVK
ncbi:hypothetical protein FNO01nite_24140 [Flavobacterium noncentrifugens]|uniref:OmpA-OmpF porin, OOP family n=1 Tax=Flavobacterium noncentrifugens TaxID=1128970 RepID=A0A1G9A1U2_9FLAO|nr:OmpA family protein [Flavobacterium noncentrifugens]GEP51742.1 hypothetical protein FNO01nite_24140 [Flavobacterium noncentrifugens]SDK21316.1 OmpA-OmpF porin, OOP family [Flavobacterium noncentrifugens]